MAPPTRPVSSEPPPASAPPEAPGTSAPTAVLSDVAEAAGVADRQFGVGAVFLDYDRDGDMDIVLTAFDEPVELFRNDVSGPDTNWLEILLDTSGDPTLAPDGYGSRVIATTGGVSQYAWVNGGANYLGRSQVVAHFGLGANDSVAELRVEWPSGQVTRLDDVEADQIVSAEPPRD